MQRKNRQRLDSESDGEEHYTEESEDSGEEETVAFNEDSAHNLLKTRKHEQSSDQDRTTNLELEKKQLELDIKRRLEAEKARFRKEELERRDRLASEEQERRKREERERRDRLEREEQERYKILQQEERERRERTFNQTQATLETTFAKHFSNGLIFKGKASYDAAISSFNDAIKTMEEYAAHWKKHELSNNIFSSPTCKYAEQKISEAKLEIADCLHSNKDYLSEYRVYEGISSNYISLITLSSKKQACIIELKRMLAIYVDGVANTDLDSSNNYDISNAKDLLLKAEEICNEIGERNNIQLQHQKTRVWWCETRTNINSQCERILGLTTNKIDYKPIVAEMRNLLANYDKAGLCLSNTERNMQQKLQVKLPIFQAELNTQLERERREVERLQNIACQKHIYKHIAELELELKEAKLPQALERLNLIINLANKITNVYDVTNAGIIHTPVTYFLNYQIYLKSAVDAYYTDMRTKSSSYTDHIIEYLKFSANIRTPGAAVAIIEPTDIAELNHQLAEYLSIVWHRFYQLNVPVALLNTVSERILNNLETLGIWGTINKYLTWSYTDLRVKNSVTELMILIRTDIGNFQMPQRTEPVVTIPDFCVPMAQVVPPPSVIM